MKRTQLLITLLAGVFVGFLCGAALTAAHSDPPKFDGDQIVAQAGETKVTRGALAQYALSQLGNKLLDGQVRDMALVDEGARRAGVTVTADEVEQRIKESFQFAEDAMARKRLEAVPHWILAEQMRPVILLEKMLKITVSPNEVENYFATNSGVFFKPATVRLTCIATLEKADAERALKRLKDGEDPGKVSEQLSSDDELQKRKGDVGWFGRNSMSPQVAEAVFEGNDGNPLKPKQFTGILNNIVSDPKSDGTTVQYLIFYVTDYAPSVQPKLDDVRPAALFYARAQKLSARAPGWFLEHLKDVEWKRIKDAGDPQSELVTVPLSAADYTPKTPPK